MFAVDVGYNILDYRLRTDPRVAVRERTNARLLNASVLEPRPGEDAGEGGAEGGAPTAARVDVVTCDASFITLKSVLPPALELCRPGGTLVALVKPQFEAAWLIEAGKLEASCLEGGVVRDQGLRDQICRDAQSWLDALPGWRAVGLTESPIEGPSGNKEYLLRGEKLGG